MPDQSQGASRVVPTSADVPSTTLRLHGSRRPSDERKNQQRHSAKSAAHFFYKIPRFPEILGYLGNEEPNHSKHLDQSSHLGRRGEREREKYAGAAVYHGNVRAEERGVQDHLHSTAPTHGHVGVGEDRSRKGRNGWAEVRFGWLLLRLYHEYVNLFIRLSVSLKKGGSMKL